MYILKGKIKQLTLKTERNSLYVKNNEKKIKNEVIWYESADPKAYDINDSDELITELIDVVNK